MTLPTLPQNYLTEGRPSALLLMLTNGGVTSAISLVRELFANDYTIVNYYEIFASVFGSHGGRQDAALFRALETLPPFEHIIPFRGPHHVSPELDLDRYKIALTLRDPRDLICSVFYNVFTHDGCTEESKKRRRAVGIDAFVLRQANRFLEFYQTYISWFERHDPKSRIFLSHQAFLKHVEIYISSLAEFLEVALDDEHVKRIGWNYSILNSEGRRFQHENAHPDWGRHQKDLRPDTVLELTEIFRDVLTFLAENELPMYRECYT